MDQKKQGILYIILAGFCFALMTFFVRLSGDLPTMEKAFFRNGVALIVSIVMIIISGESIRIKKGAGFSLFMRCFCGTVGLICNFYAIDHLNIADANILNKLSPFFAIIMSYFILDEKAGIVQWICVAAAFIGAIFVVKPSFHMEFAYAMVGVLGGFGAGIAYTFVRKLGAMKVKSPVIVMYFSLFSCLVTLPFIFFNFKPMTLKQLLFLIAAGICATGGQFSITTAYKKAPAGEISVFDYTQVIFAALLGFVFLGQIPDILSITGYVIIIGSAVFKWKHQ